VCNNLNAEEEVEYDYALRGKAWQVYWLLLKTGKPMSVREVQRALHFSSPSVANHHLDQLCHIGLVQKRETGGDYVLVSDVKIGVLRHFVKLGRLVIYKSDHARLISLLPFSIKQQNLTLHAYLHFTNSGSMRTVIIVSAKRFLTFSSISEAIL